MLAVHTSAGVPHGFSRSAGFGFSSATFLALISFLTSISFSPYLTTLADSLLISAVSASACLVSKAFLASEAASWTF